MATPIQKKRQNTHIEKIFEEKNTDKLLKLMKDIRLLFKRAHRELIKRDKQKKLPHLDTLQ